MSMEKESELVSNRKAFHEYEIIDTFETGIVLKGTEVKSLKNHGGSLQDSYVIVEGNELFLINATIAPYSYGALFSHEEKRKRKLLMHRREIERLKRLVQEKSYVLIPLSFYLKKGKIKLKICVGRGKKKYEKREKIKEKEYKKSIKFLT